MSKFLRIALPALVILVAATWFLFKTHQVGRDPGWSTGITKSSNALGMLAVQDEESGTTLFWYHSDPDAHPIRIEKQDANHWVVVFEKVPK